jgi:spore maturation protein CgeB
MRLLRITTLYERYLEEFYGRNPALRRAPYAVQRAALDHDAFGWADFWSEALRPQGYEVLDVALNARPIQRAWAREHLGRAARRLTDSAIGLAQARAFQPDVVWLDVADEPLIRRIREEVPSVRLVLGWLGSLVPDRPAWRHVDLMLSCAPELVERLARQGLRAAQLHHGYDPRMEARLESGPNRWEVSFVGQIPAGEATHTTRARLLERIREETDIAIFSPDGTTRVRDAARARLRGAVGALGRGLLRAGLPERSLRRFPRLARAATEGSTRRSGISEGLRRAIRPPVFGLAMFQVLRDSHATLNVHADYSPRFACNMRLYEATGVGACLVTDWRENLAELFDLDREVVAYRGPEELLEKLRWLASAPAERAAIAEAGRKRVLRDHTYAHRAERLDRLIREAIR